MIVGIDIRVLARGKKTGIEEYTSNLLSFLLTFKNSEKIKYKLFYNAFNKVKLDYSWIKPDNVELKEFKLPNRILDLLTLVFKKPTIDKFLGPVDIFFSPHFLPISLPQQIKRVITIHDLSFKHHPQFFSFSRKLWHFLTFPKKQVKKADKIITDSFSTKEDLIKIYGIEPEKIDVIYLGIGSEFKPKLKTSSQLKEVKNKYNLPDNFILYFGTIEPRKNLALLIKAFENIKENFSDYNPKISWAGLEGRATSRGKNLFDDLKLVIAGSKGWLYKDVIEKTKKSKHKEDIIFTGTIDSIDKPFLYNLASIFIYPSFFEGFGFPPLEAMACGTPTIVSNTSSLPEVVGDGAIMIDPYNVDELTYAIKKVLEDKELRNNLTEKGFERVKKFDWGKTAKQTLEVFCKIK